MGIVVVKQWASFAYNNGHRFILRMLMCKSTECRAHGADMLGRCHSYTIMTATSRLLALRHLLRETSIPRLNAGVTLENTPPVRGMW